MYIIEPIIMPMISPIREFSFSLPVSSLLWFFLTKLPLQKALKEKGIDVMVERARQDNSANDDYHMKR